LRIKKVKRDIGFCNEEFRANIHFWIGGLFAFIWVVLRSGTNPKRLTYPCQQAAYPLASSWLIALAVLVSGSLFLKRIVRYSTGFIIVLLAGWFMISAVKKFDSPKGDLSLPIWNVSTPVSEIYLLDNIPVTTGSLAAGNETVPNEYLPDPAVDTLLMIMEYNGVPLYQTPSVESGMIQQDEVVIIKGNFQWAETLSTNTDRIKGLIWKILQYPGGFSGEILVCDNTQGVRNLEECNNSEDPNQSIIDVVNTFYAKGFPVYMVKWDTIMNNVVEEYSQGNMANGFVYNSSTKVSYPKFKSLSGNYISLSKGIWDIGSSSYDRSGLFIINFPVVKAHGYTGATLGVKNWVGVMTIAYKTERYGGDHEMHYDYIFGEHLLTPKIMAETFPDLTIIDGTWTAPTNNYIASPANRIRTDVLLASTDPVASSWFTAKYILSPVADSPNSTNPDNPGGTYNLIFNSWANYLITNAGFNLTRDSSSISIYGRESMNTIEVTSITVQGEGGISTIDTDNGTLQMIATVLPENASDKSVTWSVTNGTGAATITPSGLLQAISDGTVTVIATACDGSGISGITNITISNQSIPVSSITVHGEGNISVINTDDGTLQMIASVLPENASDKSVNWSVINETGEATITLSGLLQAVSDGVVTVIATASDGSGISGNINITISNQFIPVSSLAILGEGGMSEIDTDEGTLQMIASVLPENATNKSVTWGVTNGTGEATITSSGLLQAVSDGMVTVTATAQDGSGVSGSTNITISNQFVPVSSITVQGKDGVTQIISNGSLQMVETVLPENASDKSVDWSVINVTGEATITSSGLLQAVSDGIVTVTATARDVSGVSGSTDITISNLFIPVSSITVQGEGGISEIDTDNGMLQMIATVLPQNASDKSVTWSVNNGTGEATITPAGLLQAVSDGMVTVTATARDGSGVNGNIDITISNQFIPVSSIIVQAEGGISEIDTDDGTLQMIATIMPENASDKSINWSVINATGEATITSSGLLQAVSDGMVTVTATAQDGSGIFGTSDITIANQFIPVSSITVKGEGGMSEIDSDDGTLQMIATVLPENASYKSVNWNVTNGTGEATITSSGLLQAVSDGTVAVTATALDGSGVTGNTDITISNQFIPISSITIQGEGGMLTIDTDDGTLQMIATVLPENATNKSVTWSVAHGTGEATITPSGFLKAISDGTVTVIASAQDGSGVSGIIEVTISNQFIQVSSITVQGEGGVSEIDIDDGTLQMIASVFPENATNKSVSWNVINGTGEATITLSGFLQAVSNGIVTVTATAEDGSGVSGNTDITISNQTSTMIVDQSVPKLNIYPNPVNDLLHIEIQNQCCQNLFMSLIGSDGKILLKFTVDKPVITINFITYEAGIYHILLYRSGDLLDYRTIIAFCP